MNVPEINPHAIDERERAITANKAALAFQIALAVAPTTYNRVYDQNDRTLDPETQAEDVAKFATTLANTLLNHYNNQGNYVN